MVWHEVDLARRRVFSNRKPGLRLESIWRSLNLRGKDIYICILILVCYLVAWGLPS
jgi:hypothetical protein